MSSYVVDYESGTPHPWSPASGVEAHNYGQADTPHATFGDFFRDATKANAGKRSGRSDLDRYTKGVPYQRCENVMHRTSNSLGLDEYFTYAYSLPLGPWGSQYVLCQPNWPSFAPPGVCLRLNPDHVTLVLAAGKVATKAPVYQYLSDADQPTNKNCNVAPMYARPPGAPMEVNVWHQFVLHVRWAADTSGLIECWHRLKGGSWVKTATGHGFATLQIQNGKVQPAVQDKWGPYRASSPTPTSIQYKWISKSSTLAEAKAYLG